MATVMTEPVARAVSHVLATYRPAAPVFVSASGCELRDADGRAYLDFGSGIGVNALGYGDAGVARAMHDALATGLIHTSNLFLTEPVQELATELTAHSFADRVFFCNSGAEANEAAFKFARRWARGVGGADKHEIVSMRNAFHGRLFGTLAATDRPSMQAPFVPLMPGVRFVDIGDVAAAAAAISSERTAAVIIEPVQGEGGVQPVSAEFLRALRELCNDAGALLIFDEVQCGLGRTGRLFAYEHTGLTPDIMTLAKPLAGGLPMGAALVTQRVADAIQPGDHATTFGGGPLVSSVALEVVRRIAAPAFLGAVRSRAARLNAALQPLTQLPTVAAVRGLGLMVGIELTIAAAPVMTAALERGLVVTTAGEKVIRLLPPLVISDEDVDNAAAILREVLQ